MRSTNEARIDELLQQLTLDEKIAMIHGDGLFQTGGVDRLGISPIKMSDGPMGVRKEFGKNNWINIGTTDDLVSYLPSNSALASTWNRALAYQTGQVLGAEARGRSKDVILAPGINIKRSPLCGRNFEYMSEDPILTSELVVPLIAGIQENDVAACVKHFAANSQETERLWVDTFVDERALREIYFPGFRSAVEKANAHTVMGAYNKFRGEHCCESKFLLGEVLREEWGFDGAVISDWGGVHDTKRAAESELDIEMSVTSDFDDYHMARPLKNAIIKGEIKKELVDKKIRNILRTMLRLKVLGASKEERKSGTYNTPQHREAVLATARESVILLKNDEQRLPIQKNGLRKLAVIGANGDAIHSNGGGSAEIKALYEISPLMGLKKALGGNTEVTFARGYYIPSKQKEKDLNWQFHSLERGTALSESEKEELLLRQKALSEEIKLKEEQLFTEAVELAKQCDEVIFIGGLNHDYDVEGKDRADMRLPYHQDRLIDALLEVNKDVVVVMVAGSPVEMNSWVDKAKAIVWSWYAGMEGGTALAEVLLGEVNPSGRLPESMPYHLSDSPAHHFGDFGNKDSVTYKEGIYVGYRYYDSLKVEPMFCFGHGLSYTDYEFRDMQVVLTEASEEVSVVIDVIIRNIGGMDGAETVQLYVANKKCSVERPAHELKNFDKVYLKVGEEKTIRLKLDQSAFGYYDVEKKCFKAEAGEYELQLGSSSCDLRQKKNIVLSRTYYYI